MSLRETANLKEEEAQPAQRLEGGAFQKEAEDQDVDQHDELQPVEELVIVISPSEQATASREGEVTPAVPHRREAALSHLNRLISLFQAFSSRSCARGRPGPKHLLSNFS